MGVIVLSKRKLQLALVCTAIFLLTCITLSHTGAYAVFYGGGNRKVPIYSVETTEKRLPFPLTVLGVRIIRIRFYQLCKKKVSSVPFLWLSFG